MRKKWVQILKERSRLTLSKLNTGRHTIDDPRACLDDSSLCFWELGVQLVD